KAFGTLLYDQFLVLCADESKAVASGCSIDKSIAFVKNIEQRYGQPLLLRTNVAFLNQEGEIEVVSLDTLKAAYRSGRVVDSTVVFDNLVSTLGAFRTKWKTPLHASWLKRFI